MNIHTRFFMGALFLLLMVPAVSNASVFSDFQNWLAGSGSESQDLTATAVIPAVSSWLDLKVNDADGPISAYDGEEVSLRWVVNNVQNVTDCKIKYPGASGLVTESVAVFGSKRVTLYPSRNSVGYIEFVCKQGASEGRDVVVVQHTPTSPQAGSGAQSGSSSGVRPSDVNAGTGAGIFGGGSNTFTTGVSVVNMGYGPTGGGGSGGINIGGIVNTVSNGIGNVRGAVGSVQNTVSGIAGNISNAIIGSRATNALNHGMTVANNAVSTHFTQPTLNWISNNVPVVGAVMRWLGIGGNQSAATPTTDGGPAAGSSNVNRNAHSSAPGGTTGSAGGGTYHAHVGPLTNGASGPADGSNNCNGGTDNCNNNNNPYGFEQDPSKVQNTNDNR